MITIIFDYHRCYNLNRIIMKQEQEQKIQPDDEKDNPTFWPGDDLHKAGETVPGKEGIDPDVKETTPIPKIY